MPSPSSAFIAQGTKLQRSPDGTTYTAISEVSNITGPSEATALQEITNHDSANFIREWMLGLIDPGTLGFTANFLPGDATQDYITGWGFAFHSRLRENYKVLIAGAHGNYSLLGLPTKDDKMFPSDGKPATRNGELKITSTITYAP